MVGPCTKTSRVIQGGMDRKEIIQMAIALGEVRRATLASSHIHYLRSAGGGGLSFVSHLDSILHPFRLDDEYLGIWCWSRATALCEQPKHEHAHAHGPNDSFARQWRFRATVQTLWASKFGGENCSVVA